MKQLFGLSEQTWLYLDQAGILAGDLLILFSLIAAIYGFLKRDTIRRWLRGNTFPNIGGQVLDKNWEGLIFTVSRAELPLWVIKQVKPKWVGLLVTEHSQQAGKEIEQQARTQGIEIKRLWIDNPDEPNQAYQQTKLMLNEIKNDRQSVAVDITGGKVTMSLGAFMAAEEAGCDSIYVATDFKNQQPDLSTARIINISHISDI